jgi:hypothetical protein
MKVVTVICQITDPSRSRMLILAPTEQGSRMDGMNESGRLGTKVDVRGLKADVSQGNKVLSLERALPIVGQELFNYTSLPMIRTLQVTLCELAVW